MSALSPQPEGAKTMKAADVRAALLTRWPAREYLAIEEAPQDAMRQGRKIDMLVVSLWKSRGHSLDAVEVKVSMSDWKRELENADKADWWYEHSHRFWIAVPLSMAPKVRDQLPEAWGLIGCTAESTKIIVQAPRHEPTPLPWSSCIGIMRAASGAGANALLRAESRGLERGVKEGTARAERNVGTEALVELREKVRAAEEATGIPIARWSRADREAFGWVGVEEVHAAVAAVCRDRLAVRSARQALENAERTLNVAHERVVKQLGDLP